MFFPRAFITCSSCYFSYSTSDGRGASPAIVRRCLYPVLLHSSQPSTDSDDEDEEDRTEKGRIYGARAQLNKVMRAAQFSKKAKKKLSRAKERVRSEATALARAHEVLKLTFR